MRAVGGETVTRLRISWERGLRGVEGTGGLMCRRSSSVRRLRSMESGRIVGDGEEFDVLVDGDGCECAFEYVLTVRGEGFFESFGDLGERFVGNSIESWGFSG